MHFAALFALTALANPLCDDIARLVEGAKEPIPFQELRDADFKPRLLRYGCFPGGVGYFCQQSMLPAEITRESTVRQIAACLPDAKITVEKQPGGPSETVITASGLRFALEEAGSDRAQAGRLLRIQITADRKSVV